MRRSSIVALCAVTLSAITAVVLSSAPAQEQGAQENNKEETTATEPATPVVHVVLFKFNADASPDTIAEIEDGFAALPTKIEGIVDFDWGINSSPENLNEGFTHCFIITFKNAAARDVYLTHPAHQEFVKVLKPHLEKPLVVDFSPK